MFAPLLSAADPKNLEEGSIDPLGLYPISDRLALELIPGVRERQRRPRFLTLIAVSHAVCSKFEDRVAADGVSEAWQVFEWYAVEGLVRSTKEPERLIGLPGREKATEAKSAGVPLCASRYLKTPSVFGFHGIYRALAKDIALERGGRLDETGYELLTAWCEGTGLTGFWKGIGNGREMYSKICDAVEDGLEKGATARNPGWSGWSFFSDHLGIYDFKPEEIKVITDALFSAEAGHRAEVLRFLVSAEGSALWRKQLENRTLSERDFHEALLPRASAGLNQLLAAISAYEAFCRCLQDAFDEILAELSTGRRLSPSALGNCPSVISAAVKSTLLFQTATESLEDRPELAIEFANRFQDFSERIDAKEWAEMLLRFHSKVQSEKPPDGKAPWIERFDDGSYMARAGFRRDKGAKGDGSYVQAYRTASLWQFARDLGLVH